MKRMVIKGSEWHRGGAMRMGGETSKLLTASGRRCCVGIHGRLCGVPDRALLSSWRADEALSWKSTPTCYRPWSKSRSGGETQDRASKISYLAMSINDSFETSDEEKIAALRPIFAEIGVSIVWRPEL